MARNRQPIPPIAVIRDDTVASDGSQKRRTGVSEEAHRKIKSAILRGEIPVGTVLGEAELAKQLGISRTPVRQVLRRLLDEDLVAVGSRRQITVAGVSPDRRREIFLLRNALESVAVSEACRRMKLEDIDYLRLILMRQKRAADAVNAADFIDLDEEFHVRMASGTDLSVLVKFLGQLRAFIRMMGIDAVSLPGRMNEVLDEHASIVDALEERDLDAALSALAKHLHETERLLNEHHDKAPASAGAPSRAR